MTHDSKSVRVKLPPVQPKHDDGGVTQAAANRYDVVHIWRRQLDEPVAKKPLVANTDHLKFVDIFRVFTLNADEETYVWTQVIVMKTPKAPPFWNESGAPKSRKYFKAFFK